jgi:hypothetical protein
MEVHWIRGRIGASVERRNKSPIHVDLNASSQYAPGPL